MNTIIVMNLTGSVMTAAYFLLKKFGGEKLYKRTLYGFLRAIVLTFLLPLNLLGEMYKSVLLLFPMKQYPLSHFYFSDRDLFVLESSDGVRFFSRALKFEGGMVIAYCAVALIMTAFWLFRDWQSQRGIRRAVAFGKRREDPVLTKLCRDYGIRGKIEYCPCEDRMAAAVMGVHRPLLLYKAPETRMEQELILSHELCHIKRHDMLWRILADLVRGLHFWNPAVYLLRKELNDLCEQSCDEWVIQDRSGAERSAYARLLVDYSGSAFSGKGKPVLALGEEDADKGAGKAGGGKTRSCQTEKAAGRAESRLERRIRLIVKFDKKKKLRRGIGSLLAGILLFACSLTTLAYKDILFYPVMAEGEKDLHTRVEVSIIIEPKEELLVEAEDIYYSAQYKDADGNVYPLTEGGADTTGAGAECAHGAHEFEDVTLTYHTAGPSGGCSAEYYSAKRCVKCGKTEELVRLKSSQCRVCPHLLLDPYSP